MCGFLIMVNYTDMALILFPRYFIAYIFCFGGNFKAFCFIYFLIISVAGKF